MGTLKEYKVKVKIHYPCEAQEYDGFEIAIPISDAEIKDIVNHSIEDLYNGDDRIESCDYIRAFAKSAYSRAIEIIEKITVPKWGDRFKSSNGAYYELHLLDDLIDAIYESEEYAKAEKQKAKIGEESKAAFHNDGKILNAEYKRGRWGDKIVGDKSWKGQIFCGLWSDGRISKYGIHTHIKLNDRILKVSYDKDYFLCKTHIKFNIFFDNPTVSKVVEDFMQAHPKLKIVEKRLVNYHDEEAWLIKVVSEDAEKDLQMYIELLDRFTAICQQTKTL